MLWFDVGIKRYTTGGIRTLLLQGCGLMQESKDIQPVRLTMLLLVGCGLMQESKDIQQQNNNNFSNSVVV